MKYLYKFQRFMYSRYGIDDLYKFLFKLYIFLFILNIFLNSTIFSYLEIFLFIIMFYRVFSKNIKSRQKENQLYLKLKKKVQKSFQIIKRNYQDREYYVYKKCKKCHTTLKLPLPKKRGMQHTKCPTCQRKITFLCLRQEKQEIIKTKKTKKR